MKERKIITGIVAFLVIGTVLATGNTDAVYVTVGVLFFAICIGYAEWCERL